MKKIGVVGGMSWVSSMEYYRLLNEMAARRLGEEYCANMVMANADIGRYRDHMSRGDEPAAYQVLAEAVASLKGAGAQILVLSANGAHRYFDHLRGEAGLPMVHIAELTATAARGAGLKKLGLLGVKATMEGVFYPEKFSAQGLDVIIPQDEERAFVHDSIFAELTRGRFSDRTRERYVELIEALARRGADGVILGCTEIPLLVNASHTNVPLLPTTEIHCAATVELAFA